MLKIPVKYKDFNDEEQEEVLYFHLSKVDIIRLEVKHPGGLKQALENIIAAEDGTVIMNELEGIFKASYGKKSPDGRKHVKNDEIWEDFASSNAYEAFFMKMVLDAELAANFIQQVVPADLVEEASNLAKQEALKIDVPQVKKDVRIYTQAEIKEMPADQFLLLAPQLASGEAVVEDVK